jgi:hypothetical protein
MAKQLRGDLDSALDDFNKAFDLQPELAAIRANREKALQMKASRNA